MVYPMQKKFSKPIIRTIWNYVWQKRMNCLIGITGRVRKGKSLMGFTIGELFDPRFDLDASLVYSMQALIDKSLQYVKIGGKPIDLKKFRNLPDVLEYLKQNRDKILIKRGKVIVLDETAATTAYVREFLSQDNKTISKLIQIWGILGLVVIFVVPEDMKIAESTIQRFLNIEIRMIENYVDKKYSTCVAWEYVGWNKKTKEPYRKRLKGCRYGGLIYVKYLASEKVKQYEEISVVYKIKTMIDMGLQYELDKPLKAGATKTIWDDINYVRTHPKEFENEKGKITVAKIQLGLGVPYHKAAIIRQHLAKKVDTHT